MKKIKSFLLLLLITFFVNAQTKHAHTGVNFRKQIKLVITDSHLENNTPNFSFYIKDDPNTVSQLSTIELEFFVSNESSHTISKGKDIFIFCIEHINGYYVNPTTCEQIKGGVGGVVIRPLDPGDTDYYSETITPNADGRLSLISPGKHLYNLKVYQLNSDNSLGKLRTQKEMNLNVIFSKEKDRYGCEYVSKTTNNLEDVYTYPNPFNDNVLFDISKQELSFPISLELYNDKGELQDIRTFKNENIKQLSYYNNQLNPGIYYYKLIAKNTIKEGKLIRK
ncbi:T9SS type A sorting domain-containing protein [Tenacibaculum agarivorans]|uniref:T9SS type A sorting domain-containing protein n=1 Tax=Tenacibaculum agarivorans TaxID=1908389 RepID=UPI00094B9029|nr:T9SS type A sorting domain-containing protein [Tenacibaculum agarivorans]